VKKLILIFIIANAPLAKGQEKVSQQLAGGHSIKSLAIELGPNFPAPDIAVIVSPNSKPKRLVKGLNPVWSPDGQKIAYCVRDGHGFGQMQEINADGSGHMQLTNVKGGACPTDWSPDGEEIAFIAYGATPSVLVMSKTGENVRRITDGYGARWSPDGTKLVLCRNAEHRGASNSIWVVNADGTGPKKVIEDDSPLLEAAWFPNGRSIVFSSERESKRRSALFRVNLDGTGLESVALDKRLSLYFPVVSPDGTQILADAYSSGSGEGTVMLFDLASREGRLLTHGAHPSVLWQKP
jgi:TolB protein